MNGASIEPLLNLRFPTGVLFEVKISGFRPLDKHFSPILGGVSSGGHPEDRGHDGLGGGGKKKTPGENAEG
jgi:hypothetical protein